MTQYFTADLHIGHRNIIDYTNRPFTSVEHMNAELVRRWNSVVQHTDDVYVLGDLALGKLSESMEVAKALRGRKFLVPGNHDRCWPGHSKVRPSDRMAYQDAGFTILPPQQTMVCRDPNAAPSYQLLLHHFPYVGDSHDTDRYVEHRPVDDGRWLLHGHIHDKWRVKDRMINVGVDVWGYAPVSQYAIMGLIERAGTVGGSG